MPSLRAVAPLLLLCILLRAHPLHAQSSSIQSASIRSPPKLVGYFPQWGLYNEQPYLVKDLVTNGGAAFLDQLNYAQGFVTNGHCSIADPNADLNHPFTAAQSVDGTADSPTQPFRGYLHQLAELKRLHPHLKLLISLEGHAADFAYDAQPEHRQAFLDSCVDLFLRGNLAPNISAPNLFDGIDIDWEYPHAADADNFLALLTELRQRMTALRPGLILSIATGPSPHMYDGTDLAAVARAVDEVGLMTYDFNGPWSARTGFIAPLLETTDPALPNQSGSATPSASPTPTDSVPRSGSVEQTIADYIDAGVPPEKLLMGIPFYGYGWHLPPSNGNPPDNGLHQEGNPIHGDRPYSYIQTLAAKSTLYRDPAAQTPWLFDGDAFWTYDDPISIHAKASYALTQHLGGLMLWELSEDTPQATLLHAAHTSLTQLPTQTTTRNTHPNPTLTPSNPSTP